MALHAQAVGLGIGLSFSEGDEARKSLEQLLA
jgi:hypothetical protein